MNFVGVGGALGLGIGGVAKAMARQISLHGASPSTVVVLGDPLARALAAAGLPVIAVSLSPRRRRKGLAQLAASPSALPFTDGRAGSIDAVCSTSLPLDALAAVREWARVVRPGGLITIATVGSALVGKVAPPEVMAAHMLHALLVDVEQCEVGATLITSARAPRFRAFST